ncbi:MAG: tetratricopeptide repeat protein [Saprospiraceae bacterium]
MHHFFSGSRAAMRITMLLFAVVIVAAGCNSSQRFGERKPIGKWYHSFTARYNGYFNANELINEAEIQLADSEELDYNELLPVYPAYSVKNPKSAAASLDKAMEKVSLVVNIHRPSRYEDDSYLLLGKAQMLKQDFEDAEYTFQYSVKDFDPANETARLRRLEKKKIAEGKSKTKKSKTRKTRSTAPSRSKEAAKRKKERDSRTKKEGSSKKKSSGKKSSASKKSSNDKKGKPKSRAEMAKQQREDRMEAEKAEIRKKENAEKAVADAERKKTEAEASRQAKIEAGKVPDAESAINDGKGLVDPVTGDVGDPNKKGLFVHESSLQDLSYWLARAHISREKYTDAERVLGKLARDGKTFKDVRRKLPAAYADLYIKKGDLAAAAPYLDDAIALSKDKQEKAHFSFILGQIQQRTGDTKGAYTSFRRVVKLKPDFEMAFNAELQLATTAYRVGQADATSTIKELRRMSKEEKYDEYRDQIFYQMAEIALESGDRPGGIEYLQESLAANLGNQTQAAKGYLRLGNLYFEDESYILANNYFDSTLQVLPKDDPRFPEIDAYARNLKPIAENLQAIALQDSLLRIADLSPEEQRDLAMQMDSDRRQKELEEAIKASREAENGPKSARPAVRRGGTAGQPTSTFFAYDDKVLRRSKKAFEKKWGDRSLIDNWRTTDASESAAVLREAEEVAESSVASEEDLAKILEEVPNSPEAKVESEAIIEQALLALGRQYREKLEKPARAAEALEEMMRRFPTSENIPEALYLAALAYDDMGESGKARAARERLKKEFPSSKYAKSLIDPAFLDAAKNAEKKLITYYDQTYTMFDAGDAKGAKQRIDKVPTEFGEDNALQSRFALLNSMVVGKLDGKEPYVAELKKVVSKYPKSEEATRAKEILRLLGERVAGAALDKAAKTGDSKVNSNFTLTPGKSHYFLAVLPKGASMAKSKAAVADYNGEYHRLEKLVIGNVYMLSNGEQTPVIVIRRFKTQEEGMSYYADVSGKMKEFMNGVEFTGLLISQGNYREVLRSKAFAEYQQFFAENYL